MYQNSEKNGGRACNLTGENRTYKVKAAFNMIIAAGCAEKSAAAVKLRGPGSGQSLKEEEEGGRSCDYSPVLGA